MNAKLSFIEALTSLHAGTGQGTGVIDLPVAREVATGIPFLPGSSLKGVLRDRCSDEAQCRILFGPEPGNVGQSNAHAGSAVFSDQRVLLLAVRSLAGTTAWVSSPFILQRLRRDCQNLGLTPLPPEVRMPTPKSDPLTEVFVVKGSALPVAMPDGAEVVMLEDLDLTARKVAVSRLWAEWLGERLFPRDATWRGLFAQRFCIVHDDVFSFLLETATEVTARNMLDENKTSANLWYEEALPAGTILQGVVAGQQVEANGLAPDEVLDAVASLIDGPLQLGGKSSVGRGMCRMIVEGK